MEKEKIEWLLNLYFSNDVNRVEIVEVLRKMGFRYTESFTENKVTDFDFSEYNIYFKDSDLIFVNCIFKEVYFKENIEFFRFVDCQFYSCEFKKILFPVFTNCKLVNSYIKFISFSEVCKQAEFEEFRRQIADTRFKDFYIVFEDFRFNGNDSLKGLCGFILNSKLLNISDAEILKEFYFIECSFYNCDLSGSIFSDSSKCSFTDCNLSEIKYIKDEGELKVLPNSRGIVDLSNTHIKADLKILYPINFNKASFADDVDLSILNLAYDISFVKLNDKNLSNFNFSEKSMRETSFIGADLSNCNFNFCDLRNCDFTNAKLDGADFRFADIRGAIFNGATLRDTIFSRNGFL